MSKTHPSLGEFLLPVQSANPVDIFGDNDFSYIDIAAVDREERRISNPQVVTVADAPSRARQLIKAGDILVSTVRPNLNTVAQVGSDLDGAIASTGFCVLRVNTNLLDRDYLFHWIASEKVVRHLSAVATGASYPAVSDKIIKSLPIALPALKEQERIAAILAKADSLRLKRRQAIRLADDFLRAVFLEMFGDPVANPKGWPEFPMGEVIEFKGGSQPPKETFSDEPLPGYVRLVQIRDFKTDKYKTYIPEKLAKRAFEEDDVMIARYGPPVFQILRGLSGSYNVALMKAQPKADILKEIIFWLLQLPAYHDVVVSNSERTAGQTGVNLELLNKLLVPLPPINVQEEIAARTKAISKMIASQRSMLDELEIQSKSLQTLFFS